MGFLGSSIQTAQQYMELGYISLPRTVNHNHYYTLSTKQPLSQTMHKNDCNRLNQKH